MRGTVVKDLGFCGRATRKRAPQRFRGLAGSFSVVHERALITVTSCHCLRVSRHRADFTSSILPFVGRVSRARNDIVFIINIMRARYSAARCAFRGRTAHDGTRISEQRVTSRRKISIFLCRSLEFGTRTGLGGLVDYKCRKLA